MRVLSNATLAAAITATAALVAVPTWTDAAPKQAGARRRAT